MARRRRANDVTEPAVGPAAALRLIGSRDFGPYFVGNALSSSGTWFQNLAGALLVYRLTHSAFLLGVLNVAQFAPVLLLAAWTGLAADRVKHREFGATDWLHLTVVPEENVDLRARVTSPGLSGADMAEAWRSVLKEPRRYRLATPPDLVEDIDPTSSWRQWLLLRYGA
jgi:hypothetical protein